MKKILFCYLLATHLSSFAQQDAWVYLADKLNVASSISNPISILSQKALDRKNNHNVIIDERDVPVNESYITQLKSTTGITVMAKSKWLNAIHVRGSQIDIEALENLSFVTAIDFADKSLNTGKITSEKNKLKSEIISASFNYGNALNQIEMFNGDELHLLDYTGTGVTIAVMDSGFPNVNTMNAFQRLRDAGNIIDDYDFVNRDDDVYTNTTDNHGTLVLSTMAGYLENQYVGTAPDASYYLFITEDVTSENPVEESYWVEAIERADSLGVDIVNTSLGYKDFDNVNYNYSSTDMDGYTAFITKGANIAFEKGLLLVTSAGNSGASGVSAPADSPNVLSIGAVDASGNYASFSSVGSAIQPSQKPDVVAQGALSYVINENDVITTSNGTSFSAPIIAGGIACLCQVEPNKTNSEIMQLVRESASIYSTPNDQLGYGIPDLQAVLNVLSTESEIGNTDNLDLKLFPNPTEAFVYLKNIPNNIDVLKITFFDILGKQVFTTFITNKNNSIDMSSLPNGLYIAKIESNSFTKTYKLVKS